MATRVKICGVTTLADARFAAGAGADYVGFVQHDKSPRYIEPARAKDIIEWLYGPEPVGVFVNARHEQVEVASALAGFRLVQLHGSETPEFCREISLPVIKSFALEPDETAAELCERMDAYVGSADYALIDTYSPDEHGGTGRVNRFSELAGVRYPLPIFLAGGLTAATVSGVVKLLDPFAVDVSSGVEESPGIKDFDKIDAFVGAVRQQSEQTY
jgi:phosphoribosylanthranilate isomerase